MASSLIDIVNASNSVRDIIIVYKENKGIKSWFKSKKYRNKLNDCIDKICRYISNYDNLNFDILWSMALIFESAGKCEQYPTISGYISNSGCGIIDISMHQDRNIKIVLSKDVNYYNIVLKDRIMNYEIRKEFKDEIKYSKDYNYIESINRIIKEQFYYYIDRVYRI